MKVLSVKNLYKKYPYFSLQKVNFEMEEGKIMGFIGRNGAGKTTTLKCLLNLVKPDEGQIEFFNMNRENHEAEIKQKLGFAFGGVNYYSHKTIKEIVKTTKTFYPEWDEEEYKKYLDLFSLNENKRVKELSEGMKVKVNLTLALSHRAKLLLLDEPTSGLDPVSRDDLLTVFKDLADKGVAILFSTQITSDLDKCADGITYIKKGKIVASEQKENFISTFGGGTLEDIMLKIEKQKDGEEII